MTFVFDRKNFSPNVGELFKNLRDIPSLKIVEAKHREDIRKLCIQVLDIYDKFLNKYHKYFTKATWDFFVKLLMGLTNYQLEVLSRLCPLINVFITNSTKQNDSVTVIFNRLLVTTFNAWIYSGITDVKLWGVFSDYSRQWMNRE